MKIVNFIQAVEYAKRGKEVYIELVGYQYRKYFIFYKKDCHGFEAIFILDENIYKQVRNGAKAEYYEYSSNNIEFYLNKWIVKDEEEDLIPPAVPCEYEPKSL